MAYHILLVEDDAQIREVIEDFFEAKSEGEMQLHIARDGEEGLVAVYEREFDLCLLDIMLPGANGFEICRAIRQSSIVPIIFLTARGREEDVLYGYHLGCDDYIVKPFSLAELYAKVHALIKRAKGMVACAEIICGEIVLNPMKFMVAVNGQVIELPPKQYGRATFNYHQGVFMTGMSRVYNLCRDPRYLDYIQRWAKATQNEDGTIYEPEGADWISLRTLDYRQPANVLFFLHEQSGDPHYVELLRYLTEDLYHNYPRNEYGGFWHFFTTPGQMWVDGLYMAGVLLVSLIAGALVTMASSWG